MFKKKLQELLIGKQSLKKRIITAFCSSFILSFILFLFGPLDLSLVAESYVSYTALEVLTTCLKLWEIIFLAMFLISWIPGGKLHVWICSLFSGLALALYIQGNFLNINLGALDGTSIEWPLYSRTALINLLYFVLIALIPFLIHFFSRKIWKNYIIFSTVLLFLMQFIPLTISLVREYSESKKADVRYVQNLNDVYNLGKENIVVFILDQTDPESLRITQNQYPDLLKSLSDFTYFDNYSTEIVGTFPSITTMMTHEPYDMGANPYMEYYYNAWHSDDALSFYKQMHDLGWVTRLYSSKTQTAGTLENEYGLISNVEKRTGAKQYSINRNGFLKLIDLSFYRYFPLIMKAPYWIATEELDKIKTILDDETSWTLTESTKYVQKFLDEGIRVGKDDKVFVTYHYRGVHKPYITNDKGLVIEGETSKSEQLAGFFYVIDQYIAQMKDMNIYDSSSIIITADHGDYQYPHSIFFVKPAKWHQDEMAYNHAPVTQLDYMATIAELAGIDTDEFGRSFFDIPENEERYRCSRLRIQVDDFPIVSGKNTNAYRQYCFIGDSDTLHTMIINEEYELFELKYSYY